MKIPREPPDEAQRLQRLVAFDILDSLPEGAYDDLVRLASHLLDAPIALISLVDANRQWFKARVGLDATQTPRDISFCGHAVFEREMLVVSDARLDPRFADNPLVEGDPEIRFYAGAPLQLDDGHVLGTLCVIDRRPRTITAQQRAMLQALARQVLQLLELRRQAARAERAAQQLRETQQAAEAASQAKSDFLANMSHELRTPLNSVIGFTNILAKNKDGALDSRTLDYLDRIRSNGQHLLRLINDVLDLSKIEAGRVELLTECVDLGAVVRAVARRLDGQAQTKSTRLGVTVPAGLQAIEGDRLRLEQILINLVGNAIKFAAGGQVEIRIRVDPQGHPLRLDVIDDGVGIATSQQSRIFESFRQADPSTRRRFGGTGLGLTIARSLCEMQGLGLTLASEPGRGSLFAVSLRPHDLPLRYEPPVLHPARPVSASPRSSPAASGPAGPRTVLVIDDDADARTVLESYLHDYGCRIVAADNGEQGVAMARQLMPDLITLDLMMPRMDGWAVLKALGEDPQLRRIPVVVSSVVGGESRASLAGAIAVLDKPVERDALYEALHEHLRAPSSGWVLVVEPDPQRRAALEQWVSATGATPCAVAAATEAFERQSPGEPAIALAPVAQGAQVVSELRGRPSTRTIPIVLHGPVDGASPTPPSGTRLVAHALAEDDIATLLSEVFERPLR